MISFVGWTRESTGRSLSPAEGSEGTAFLFSFIYFLAFSVFRFFSPSMYLGYWRVYVVPVVSSTMTWHCIVHSAYSVTMYISISVSCFLRLQSLYLSMTNNQHGHGVCWTSMGRKKTVSFEEHTHGTGDILLIVEAGAEDFPNGVRGRRSGILRLYR